ncbi:MAG TPA: Lrp/AsnC family transcriptional regulator [Actinomycetales bacterium]|nr:Lrp/AsnC family transcriptional regulator [Actinomycetales bacterium]
MDAVDRQLLDALRANARASWAELGRQIGLSGPSVQERVRRLEERGVIVGYRTVLAPAEVSLGVSALIGLIQGDDVESEDVADQLRAVPEVEDCWYVAGEENFVVKVRAGDVTALEAVVAKLRRLPGVSRTRTTVVLSTRWEGRDVPLPADD